MACGVRGCWSIAFLAATFALAAGCGGANEAENASDAGSGATPDGDGSGAPDGDGSGAPDGDGSGAPDGDGGALDGDGSPSDSATPLDAQDAADAVSPTNPLPATCGELLDSMPPAPLGKELGRIPLWTSSSAPNVLQHAYLAGSYLQGNTSCPKVTIQGDNVTITGGCSATDKYDGEISGKLTGRTLFLGLGGYPPVRTMLADVTYKGWTVTSMHVCAAGMPYVGIRNVQRLEGTVRFLDAPDGGVAFDIDLRESVSFFFEDPSQAYITDCAHQGETIGQCYSGSAKETDNDHDGQPELVVWNGTGRVGNSYVGGAVYATTADEIIDSGACSTEAASGTTTVSAGGTTVLFQYDGATDCNPQSTVTWALDGTVQGELKYVPQ